MSTKRQTRAEARKKRDRQKLACRRKKEFRDSLLRRQFSGIIIQTEPEQFIVGFDDNYEFLLAEEHYQKEQMEKTRLDILLRLNLVFFSSRLMRRRRKP